MAWITKTRVKYVLAGAGVLYLALFAGYLVYSGSKPKQPQGPSELELHPEKQDEIVAQRRAQELKERLKLSDEQTKQIADIYQQKPPTGSDKEDPRERWRATQDSIDKVLTPEQKAQLEQERGQPGGPGRPGDRGGFRGMMMDQGRIDSLKEKMTPDQRERFDKQVQQMQKRMNQQRENRGQGRGDRGAREDGGRKRNELQ